MVDLLPRIALSLVIVFGLLWFLAKLIAGPSHRSGKSLHILARQQLSRGSAIAIVRVADRALVLGISDHGVTLLTETDLDSVPEWDPQSHHIHSTQESPMVNLISRMPKCVSSLLSAPAWTKILNFFRDRTVRRP